MINVAAVKIISRFVEIALLPEIILLKFPTPIEAAVVGIGSLIFNVKQLVFKFFALSV